MQVSNIIEKTKGIKKETWIGDVSEDFDLIKGKYLFVNNKKIVGDESENYERLSLTLKGVLKRSKEDNEGLQPKDFETYQIVNKNELIFKLIDLNNISTSRIGLSPYTGIVSPAYIILKPKKQILPKYAEYFYYILWVFEIFNLLGDEGVRSNLNSQDLLDLYVPVPDIEEQKSIIDFLDNKCQKIDDAIEKINKQIEVLKKYKQSLITEVVTKGLDKNVEMKDSGVDWIGKIPKKWEVKRLKYVINSLVKGNGITKEEVIEDGDTPCVRYGELYTKYNHSFDKCVSYTNKDIIENKQYFYKGSILFTCTGELIEEIGKSIVYKGNDECLAGGDTLVVKTSENAEFINYVSNSYAQIQKSIGKAKLKVVHISAFDISNLLIAVPTIDEQIKIVEFLNSKCEKIANILDKKSKQIEILERYKKSLIYEYVTGKKRVKQRIK